MADTLATVAARLAADVTTFSADIAALQSLATTTQQQTIYKQLALYASASTMAVKKLQSLVPPVVVPPPPPAPTVSADGDYLGVDPTATTKTASSQIVMANGAIVTLVSKQLLFGGTWDGITAGVVFVYKSGTSLIQFNGTNWYSGTAANWTQVPADPRAPVVIPPPVVTPPAGTQTGPFTYNGFGCVDYDNNRYAGWESDTALTAIRATGANWVELGYMLTQAGANANTVTGPQQADSAYLHAMAKAKDLGLNVFVKVYNLGAGGDEGQIKPTDPAAWFASYTPLVVHAATIAQQGGATLFGIGNEMYSLSGAAFRQYWVTLVAQVRKVFSGKLTYSAVCGEAGTWPLTWLNSGTGSGGVCFWDLVDFPGVDAYFPLTTLTNPTLQQMHDAWNQPNSQCFGQTPIAYCQALAKLYGKQVLFPEIGYCSNQSGNANYGGSPTVTYWNQNDPAVNLQLEADAWTATFSALIASNASNWLAGIFIWHWAPYANIEASWGWGGFEVEGKPAAQTITKVFSQSF